MVVVGLLKHGDRRQGMNTRQPGCSPAFVVMSDFDGRRSRTGAVARSNSREIESQGTFASSQAHCQTDEPRVVQGNH